MLRKRIANAGHVQGADVAVMFVVPVRRATPVATTNDLVSQKEEENTNIQLSLGLT